MTDALTPLDATFLELEQRDEGALMHIGGVMVFEALPGGGAPHVEDLSADLARRLDQLPRYAQRLSSVRTGRFSWPRWTEDERFDIGAHIGHVVLPAPGGVRELCDWAADFYSHRLDRTRPLWEVILIEGLQDGRWAIAHKTHHCLVDGVGSVNVAYLLLDSEPSPSAGEADGRAQARPPASARPGLAGLLQPVIQAAQAGTHAAQAGVQAALHPREALARSRSLAELIVRDELIGAPRSSLNVPIGSTRRYRVRTVTLADLKAVRRQLGGSVNDAVLAACTTGLRELLLARGEEPPRRGLRAMVPMNLRVSTEQLALGNRISSLFVELPVATQSPRERHRLIVQATERLKSSGAAAGASAMVDLVALAPPVLHATVARSLYASRLFNLTITNVPGPQIPLYCFGAPLCEVYPVVPLAAAHAIGIAIFSFNGLVTFGVIADSESTPDIDVLADGIEQGTAELLELARELGQQPTVN